MFSDRKDAGEKLGKALDKYKDKNVLVLAIPRGGVETAYYVASHLNAELSMVITRKLGYPSNPEAAMGAVAEDGSMYLTETGVSQREIEDVLADEKEEIERRIKKFRNGKSLPLMEGRTVIIVDDGIATGATLLATIQLCKKRKASRIVVAAPVSGKRMINELKDKVDEVVILSTPTPYFAVSQGYQHFTDLNDDEVLEFMNRWNQESVHIHR